MEEQAVVTAAKFRYTSRFILHHLYVSSQLLTPLQYTDGTYHPQIWIVIPYFTLLGRLLQE